MNLFAAVARGLREGITRVASAKVTKHFIGKQSIVEQAKRHVPILPLSFPDVRSISASLKTETPHPPFSFKEVDTIMGNSVDAILFPSEKIGNPVFTHSIVKRKRHLTEKVEHAFKKIKTGNSAQTSMDEYRFEEKMQEMTAAFSSLEKTQRPSRYGTDTSDPVGDDYFKGSYIENPRYRVVEEPMPLVGEVLRPATRYRDVDEAMPLAAEDPCPAMPYLDADEPMPLAAEDNCPATTENEPNIVGPKNQAHIPENGAEQPKAQQPEIETQQPESHAQQPEGARPETTENVVKSQEQQYQAQMAAMQVPAAAQEAQEPGVEAQEPKAEAPKPMDTPVGDSLESYVSINQLYAEKMQAMDGPAEPVISRAEELANRFEMTTINGEFRLTLKPQSVLYLKGPGPETYLPPADLTPTAVKRTIDDIYEAESPSFKRMRVQKPKAAEPVARRVSNTSQHSSPRRFKSVSPSRRASPKGSVNDLASSVKDMTVKPRSSVDDLVSSVQSMDVQSQDSVAFKSIAPAPSQEKPIRDTTASDSEQKKKSKQKQSKSNPQTKHDRKSVPKHNASKDKTFSCVGITPK